MLFAVDLRLFVFDVGFLFSFFLSHVFLRLSLVFVLFGPFVCFLFSNSDSLAGSGFAVGNGGGAGSGVGVDAGDGASAGIGVDAGSGGADDGDGVGDGDEITSWASRFIGNKIDKTRPRIRSLMRNVNGTKQERSQHLGS